VIIQGLLLYRAALKKSCCFQFNVHHRVIPQFIRFQQQTLLQDTRRSVFLVLPPLSMFRNGINVGRRPLFAQSSSLASAVAHSRHKLPFVCIACQARAMSTQPRSTSKSQKKPKSKSENFLGQIKRLEAHVQEMERNYVEQLRKRAVEKVRFIRWRYCNGSGKLIIKGYLER